MSLSEYESSFLNELIKIPSVGGRYEPGAPYGKNPKAALDYFLNEAASHGFITGTIDDKVGYAEYGKGDKLIGIVCHLDVVPKGDGWHTDPFTLTVKDGVFYGRGIVDDKGPACASFFAMLRLIENNSFPDVRVRLILGTDEERTCSCVETYAEKGEIPDFAITPDAEFPVIFAEKGILHIRVFDRVRTGLKASGGSAANMVPDRASMEFKTDGHINYLDAEGKTAHASKPELGINAILKLAEKLNETEFDLSASPLFDFMQNEINGGAHERFTNCDIDDISGRITANPAVLDIDEDGESLVIDIRYPVSCDLDKLMNDIEICCGKYGLSVERLSHMGPLFKDKDTDEIKALTEVWEANMGRYDGFKEEYREIYTRPLAIGGGTYARHMPNTIAFGVQTPWQEDQCHQADEHMSVNDFEANIELLKQAIVKLAEIKKEG